MKKAYLGIDIGSISTKGVIIDEENNVIRSCYLWTEGSPINAVKRLLKELFKAKIDYKQFCEDIFQYCKLINLPIESNLKV